MGQLKFEKTHPFVYIWTSITVVSTTYLFLIILFHIIFFFLTSFSIFFSIHPPKALNKELLGSFFRPASLCIKYSKPKSPPLCFLFRCLAFLFFILLYSLNRRIYKPFLEIRLYLTVNCLLPNLTTLGLSNFALITYFLLNFKLGKALGVVFVLTICFIFLLRHQYYRLILIQEPINLHPLFVLFQNRFFHFRRLLSLYLRLI